MNRSREVRAPKASQWSPKIFQKTSRAHRNKEVGTPRASPWNLRIFQKTSRSNRNKDVRTPKARQCSLIFFFAPTVFPSPPTFEKWHLGGSPGNAAHRVDRAMRQTGRPTMTWVQQLSWTNLEKWTEQEKPSNPLIRQKWHVQKAPKGTRRWKNGQMAKTSESRPKIQYII